MIEFKGRLTGNCKKRAIKSVRIRLFIALLCTFITVCVPCVLVSHILEEKIILIVLIVPAIMVLGSILVPGEILQKVFIPVRVYIDPEEYTFIYEFEKRSDGLPEDFKMLDDVLRVVDHGEWYEVIIDVGLAGGDINCQKDLLTQGTIEEFEALFEGKIEKKRKV